MRSIGKKLNFALALSFLLFGRMTMIASAAQMDEKEVFTEPPLTYYNLEGEDEVRGFMNDPDYDGPAYMGLEPKYNPLENGGLPEIKNQSPYGTCWAFATMGLGEVGKYVRERETVDLSELHLAYFSYHTVLDPLGGMNGDSNVRLNDSFLGGGNMLLAANVLAGWTGAASEETAPYDKATDALKNGLEDAIAYEDLLHLQGIYQLNIKEDAEFVKSLIKERGGVGISYYSNMQYYNSEHCSYYATGSETTNHAVMVVGWDDGFPKENFNTPAKGDGAWLVRNSWGGKSDEYGYYSYFWMSYYDTTLHNAAYALLFEDADNYDHNYQYDGAMWSAYYAGENKLQGANVFTAKANPSGNEKLKAVSFSTNEANENYKVEIYKDLADASNPESGTLVESATTTGTTTAAGYYTVPLKMPVTLEEGTCFSAVVTLTKDNGKVALHVEHAGETSWFSTITHAEKGQSFINMSGSWFDCGERNDGNIRIKAFTDSHVPENPITDISLSAAIKRIRIGDVFTLETEVAPFDTDTALSWKSSDNHVAVVSEDGQVRGVGLGTAVITAYGDGVSETCTVLVKEVPEGTFRDVNEKDWFCDAVYYAYINELMSGAGDGTFAPNDTTNRAMVVQILYNTVERPSVSGESGFHDVAPKEWYANAVTWALQNGITSGVSSTRFAPVQKVTRQEVAMFLYKQAQLQGYDTTGRNDLASFTDSNRISGWALEAMQWANHEGIINGKSGRELDPQGPATRAEIAVMMRGFMERYQ